MEMEFKQMNDPIKHHFIPQFILKNFTHHNEQIYYWSKKTSKIEVRNTRSVYMVKNLYRDEKNHPTDPAIIEKKFAKLESVIAILFHEKIIGKEPIVLSRHENEKLRKFLFLLSFRSSARKQQYIDANFDETTKSSLAKYVKNEDYVDLWLREIDTILDTENYHEIQNSKNVSWEIRTDFRTHLSSYYMTFVTPRGQDFLLCDIYPTAEIYPLGLNGANLYAHFIFPISPNLLLLLNHIAFKPGSNVDLPITNNMVTLSMIKGNSVKPPKAIYIDSRAYNKEDIYTYKINKIYKNEVEYINMLMLNEVNNGFSFTDIHRIKDSIKKYQEDDETRAYNKNDYSSLIRAISDLSD